MRSPFELRSGATAALLGVGLVVMSCSADRGNVPVDASVDASVSTASVERLVESRGAATRIAELRARFRLPLAVATRFELDAATQVRAVLPIEALRGVSRRARVGLPVRASDEVRLEDETSHLSVRFALDHVQNTPVEVAGGMALYRGALDGADLLHRVHAEGTEDFVVFEKRPPRAELSYSVDVSGVPGLRLVSNTLEFLDETGTPLLRVAPPYVVDANGQRHEAKLTVKGCDHDTNPAGPWGRKITKPGAGRCAVRVAWREDVAYPAMVDPGWAATGSMATARYVHAASVLPSGGLLVAGGAYTDSFTGKTVVLASAELFDPAGNAGAGTFAATGSMANARFAHAASVLPSGKVLVVGGLDTAAGGVGRVYLASAELFDPTGGAGSGTFTATASMATARYAPTASVLPSGKVLVAGGQGVGDAALETAELFDPAGNAGAGTFAATGSMANARVAHTASVLPSGKVLVAGGYNLVGPNYLASAELFDPAGNAGAGTFAVTGSMANARHSHTASVLQTGTVLIAGGHNGVTLASAELFHPTGNAGAGAFVATGYMANARGHHTASVLPSGKVLVAGGLVASVGVVDVFLASAQLFEPAGNAGAGTFVATKSMGTARGQYTASVLASGKVLVAGGYNGGAYLAGAELFDPLGVLGEACVPGYCRSGFCVDGMCCNEACGASCKTCQPVTGVCIPVIDRDDDDSCAGVNTCNLAGACTKKLAQSCGSGAECASGFCADGNCCNAACSGSCETCNQVGKVGTCTPVADGTPGANPACAGVLCDGDQRDCPTACTGDPECPPAEYCASRGTCKARKTDGMACNTITSCKVAGCRECTSVFCVDGVCCDTACTGTCQTCSAALKQNLGFGDGTCGPIKDGMDPRNGCTPSGVLCGSDGQCNGTGACRAAAPAGTSCGSPASCTSTTVTSAAICDGSGSCRAGKKSSCGAYVCGATGCMIDCANSSDCAPGNTCDVSTAACVAATICDGGSCGTYACGATGCRTDCENSSDCAPGNTCDVSTGACIAGAPALCDGDHTTAGADGAKRDCTPYKCTSNGACRATCSSTNDCVAPTSCDPTGKCVPPAADTGGGCSVVSAPAADAPWQVACLAAVAGLALVRRRRRGGIRASSTSPGRRIGRSAKT